VIVAKSPLALLGRRSGAFRFRLFASTAKDVFRKLLASRFAVPLLKGFVRDFSLDEKLCEFSSLSLALEGHRSSGLPICRVPSLKR
jgi:hypothetical protein